MKDMDLVARLSRVFDPAAGFAVAALALIGLVKAQAIRDALPVDATLLAAAMCVGLGLLTVVMRRALPIEALWVGLFMVALLPGLLWATDTNNSYAGTKVHELLTLVPACLLAPVLLLATARARKWFLFFVVATAIVPAWIVLTAKVDPLYGRATVADLNPIGIARVLAAAAVVTAVCALRVQHRWFRVASVVASVLLLYGVWRTGSRGPLLAAFVGVAFVAVTSLARRASRRTMVAIAVGAAVVVGVVVALVVFNHGSLLHRDTGESDSERFALYSRSLQLLASHPGGVGWGNLIDHLDSTQIIVNQGWAQYSHNMLLEVGVEGGWIALAALLALMVVSFRRLLARGDTLEGAALLALWIFAVAVAMTSSDFTSNRLTLVMIGVGLLRPITSASLAPSCGHDRAGLASVEHGAAPPSVRQQMEPRAAAAPGEPDAGAGGAPRSILRRLHP